MMQTSVNVSTHCLSALPNPLSVSILATAIRSTLRLGLATSCSCFSIVTSNHSTLSHRLEFVFSFCLFIFLCHSMNTGRRAIVFQCSMFSMVRRHRRLSFVAANCRASAAFNAFNRMMSTLYSCRTASAHSIFFFALIRYFYYFHLLVSSLDSLSDG